MVKYKALQLLYADMAELADAHGSGPCESNFMEVQVLLSAPRRSKLYIACSDFLKVRARSCRCSSFSAKSHAAPSLFACKRTHDASACYQLFAGAPSAHGIFIIPGGQNLTPIAMLVVLLLG